MKKTLTILTFLSLITCLVSCDKEDDTKNSFYESDYRMGLWVNPDKKDTLDFINSTNLIRKGDYFENENYLYRIEGENLFISLPNSSDETHHPILNVEENSVTLGNMYISLGSAEIPGLFFKEPKN